MYAKGERDFLQGRHETGETPLLRQALRWLTHFLHQRREVRAIGDKGAVLELYRLLALVGDEHGDSEIYYTLRTFESSLFSVQHDLRFY